MSRTPKSANQRFSGFQNDKTAIGKRLRRLSDLIDRDSRRVYESQNIDFEQRWFGVLNQLVLNGPMSVKNLAMALGVTHASVSEARKSLEAAKLIRAVPDQSDGRQRLLHLTAAGERLLETLHPAWLALEECSIELNDEAGDVAAALDLLDAALRNKSLYERVMDKLK